MNFEFQAIGTLKSGFKDRFGVPRQPGLAPHALGTIVLNKDDRLRAAIKGLESFSHIWVIFVFHESGSKSWRPTVRPPRLGGNKKVGVLASRSPHRPNPIGMSALKLEAIREEGSQILIDVSGVDLVSGTPILDIKPYIPYADSIDSANAGWASEQITRYPIKYTENALKELEVPTQHHPEFGEFLEDVLSLDPRPAFQKRKNPLGPNCIEENYGFLIYGWDVKYQLKRDHFLVTSVVAKNC